MFLSVQRKLMGGAFKRKAVPKVKICSKREVLNVHGLSYGRTVKHVSREKLLFA
jgi:hypothetical protein